LTAVFGAAELGLIGEDANDALVPETGRRIRDNVSALKQIEFVTDIICSEKV
jgi:hypothetical protein